MLHFISKINALILGFVNLVDSGESSSNASDDASQSEASKTNTMAIRKEEEEKEYQNSKYSEVC